MSSKSKQKGYRAEAAIVDALIEAGISAKRQPLSGMMKDYKGDVILESGKILEIKHRENIGEYFWEWLAQGGSDYLVIKKNGKKPLVVMTFDQFTELLNRKPVDA